MYYLKDLALIGCGFIAKEQKPFRFGNTILTGDLIHNGKLYPVSVIHYHNGKPARLYDVLGSSREDADANLSIVAEYVEFCIHHNINGIRTNMRKRILLSIFRTLATVITVLFYFFLLLNYFSGKLSVASVKLVMATVLCVICFYANSVTRKY